MNFFSGFFAALIFSMACNLDTVLLSAGYALRGVRITLWGSLIIAVVTTVITGLSLALGKTAASAITVRFSDVLGGLVLVGIGAWFLLDYLRHLGGGEGEDTPSPTGSTAWVPLAAALAVNNAGAGVAAGVSGISPWLASACNLIVTLLFLPLGGWLGRGAAGRVLGKYALPLSGALLVALGLWRAFL